VAPHRKHFGLCQHVYIINITSMKVTQKHVNLLFSVTDQDIKLNLHSFLITSLSLTDRGFFVKFYEIVGRGSIIRDWH